MSRVDEEEVVVQHTRECVRRMEREEYTVGTKH